MVQARARARFVRMSPRKARQVMDLIRGKPVEEAQRVLRLSPRRAAVPIEKTLRSAVANAVQAEGSGRLSAADLTVKTALVDVGATLKRWRPRAMGRATLVRRRTSHLTVVVEGSREAEEGRPARHRGRSRE